MISSALSSSILSLLAKTVVLLSWKRSLTWSQVQMVEGAGEGDGDGGAAWAQSLAAPMENARIGQINFKRIMNSVPAGISSLGEISNTVEWGWRSARPTPLTRNASKSFEKKREDRRSSYLRTIIYRNH